MESACAKFWRLSNPVAPPVWEGRHACYQCPAGAARCGQVVDPFVAAHDKLMLVCPRCTNPTDRIINDRLCVSCYNRDLEVQRGRNAKGGRPRLMGKIGAVSCTVVHGDQPERRTVQGVTGLIEAAMAAARAASEPVMIGRPRQFSPAFLAPTRGPRPHQLPIARFPARRRPPESAWQLPLPLVPARGRAPLPAYQMALAV
jgi:hypothetical protein